MDINEIFNTPRKVVDVENIQLPENEQPTPENDQANNEANGENTQANEAVTMSLHECASMCIVAYNVIQTAIYKRIEPDFDAALTPDESKAIQIPLEAVLSQYNVTMKPTTALIVTLVGVNVGKIMAIKMIQSQRAAAQAAAAVAENAKKGVQVSEQPTAGSVTTTAPAPAEKKETKKTKKDGK